MCQFIKLIICCLIFGVASHAGADVEIKPEDENLAGKNRPLSQEYHQFDRDDLRGMTAEKLANMSLDDPLLRYAYIHTFLLNYGGLANLEPADALILEDMRRRGESITPLLLELARQNQDSMFESRLLNRIAEVGNIDLEPYIEYARTLLQERTQTMNSSLAECASLFLANHGSEQDLALLKKVIEERSYTARGVTKSLKVFESRSHRRKLIESMEMRENKRSHNGGAEIPHNKVSAKEQAHRYRPTAPSQEAASSTPWRMILVLIVLISGLLFWLRKLLK